MKTVLFCGGQGMRLREYSDKVPKPLVPVGRQPIMWNLMRYYAHYGHEDFVLALGHGGQQIKEFFLNYNEAMSNDFVLHGGNRDVNLLNTDIASWRITFLDTGQSSNIGQRLLNVKDHVKDEEFFFANYSDGLSNLDLDSYLEWFKKQDKVASFISVTVPHVFHVVESQDDGSVQSIECMNVSKLRINGGFFIFRKEIYDYINPGEELVMEPFSRLIERDLLVTHKHDGFWRSMDTFKDKQSLDELQAEGNAPWEVWKQGTRD